MDKISQINFYEPITKNIEKENFMGINFSISKNDKFHISENEIWDFWDTQRESQVVRLTVTFLEF